MKDINKIHYNDEEEGVEKIVPFQVFQAHCIERDFKYAGKPGLFHVGCRFGKDKCNRYVCPIWNSYRVRDVPQNTLRELNLILKKETLNKRGFNEPIPRFHARPNKRN